MLFRSSLCTAVPSLGIDSVRHAHDFRAMRFCLPIRLGMAITFALASHSVRYTRHFRFMRFRPVRLQNPTEFHECLARGAPLFAARSRSRGLLFFDDLAQLYTMILTFPSVALPSETSANFARIRSPRASRPERPAIPASCRKSLVKVLVVGHR